MKEITPNYYYKFHCIADRCRHNCCIGWEIDIDEDTAEMYSGLNTPLGEKIRNNIEGEPIHFLLGNDERCPFLGKDNLCEIIKELGQVGLCDICRLHPRFRNYYSDFVETGLGLCCEEAARVLLSEEDKFNMDVPQDAVLFDDEKEFFTERTKIFSVLQNRKMSIKQRFALLAEQYNFSCNFDLSDICRIYISLERLDEQWMKELESLMKFRFDGKVLDNEFFAVGFEQLACYFVFRHFKIDAFVEKSEILKFALMSCYIIGALWQVHGCKPFDDKAVDIVRMYSSEIEYSEENMEQIFLALQI